MWYVRVMMVIVVACDVVCEGDDGDCDVACEGDDGDCGGM